jgi:hypothetical protein
MCCSLTHRCGKADVFGFLRRCRIVRDRWSTRQSEPVRGGEIPIAGTIFDHFSMHRHFRSRGVTKGAKSHPHTDFGVFCVTPDSQSFDEL